MILTDDSEFTADIALVSYQDLADDLKLREKYLQWLNDFEVVAPIISPELIKVKDMSFIEESFRRFTKEEAQGFFIKYHPFDDYVGTIKLDKINQKNKSGELGLMIGEKSLWNKQIGSKATAILLKYAFEYLQLHKVWGGTDEHNIAMKKLFLKAGFKLEGRLRQVNCSNGIYSDNFYYGIISEEYFELIKVNN
ncbi:MAG TPA: hypothetical protein DD381_03660 [Lentisphaeria bacterium]|nr:MAG: hypothetical protein A2X47_09180 [Lentisphaerae bacterium GWF2_38_69]HBM15429.1 hypothetical protein [Lentisphaeria bacterium]